MKKDEPGKAEIGMSFTDDDLHYLTHVNTLLRSLFSNCVVYLINRPVYNSNGLYGHKVFFPINLTLPKRNNEVILASHGYEFEKEPNEFEKSLFIDREDELLLKKRTNFNANCQLICFNAKSYCFQIQKLD